MSQIFCYSSYFTFYQAREVQIESLCKLWSSGETIDFTTQ